MGQRLLPQTLIELYAHALAIEREAFKRFVELEQITPQATRMRITARGGSLFYDNATAVELVQQTEKLLEAGLALKNTPAPAAAAGASLPASAF